MSRSILTLNAGSSSIKFGLFRAVDEPEERLSGLIDRIGAEPHLKLKMPDGGVEERDLTATEGNDHGRAIATVLDALSERVGDARIAAIGHRVVHGGPDFTAPTALDAATLDKLKRLSPFAPLHQPHNLAGIRAALDAYPDALHLACFDTAFHRNHPWVNDVFAIPRHYYDKGVRRYGFHGLSYEFIASELERTAPHLYAGRVVVAHLGNGASMCAMLRGRSVGSTMGFSALDGLPMGTRSGQIDPGVLLYLMQQEGLDADAISDLLYRRSGLLGLSGLSNDMRTLETAGTPEADQAIDYFVFRIRRELGGLAAVLGGIDALVFCGGIGENSASVRARVCDAMDWIGLEIDRGRNGNGERIVSTDLSRVRVLVIPTNEELVIARACQSRLS